jgi:hypothetical protein
MSSKIKKECVHSPARTRPPRKAARSGKQQVQGKESHSDTSQLSRSLSSDDLDCIVQATGIPEGLRSGVRQSVALAVRIVERRNWDRSARRWEQTRAAAKQIARLTKDLRNTIYEAKDLVGKYVWGTVEWTPDDYEGDDSTISLYDFLSILDDVGEGFERLTSDLVKQVANRPPGTVKNPALSFLIDRLYKCIVEKGQGELTLWENVDRELRGTLPMVLKILHDRLPDKVPANLSCTTLRRRISSAKRKSAASRPSI